MNITQIDKFDMPIPNDCGGIGLLINVHVNCRPTDDEMDKYASSVINADFIEKYNGIAVVFWLQLPKKERLKCVEKRRNGTVNAI